LANSIREFADRTVDPHIVGFLHTPETPNGQGFVLTHGAGGNAQALLLRALADTFANAGYAVLRCNLPYRQARSFGPPGPGDAARDRAGLKNAVVELKKLATGRVFLGGHSYGGRQSSMLCAEEPDLVSALLLLSYPLHPPRRPEQQRTQHLPDLRTPTLFVQGARDPFGSIEEIGRAIKMIPAKTKLLTIEGAGHDLGYKGKAKEGNLAVAILGEFQTLMA
jgi:predicted alpha/beta-hydrolase family hydrolase